MFFYFQYTKIFTFFKYFIHVNPVMWIIKKNFQLSDVFNINANLQIT